MLTELYVFYVGKKKTRHELTATLTSTIPVIYVVNIDGKIEQEIRGKYWFDFNRYADYVAEIDGHSVGIRISCPWSRLACPICPISVDISDGYTKPFVPFTKISKLYYILILSQNILIAALTAKSLMVICVFSALFSLPVARSDWKPTTKMVVLFLIAIAIWALMRTMAS